MKMVLLMHKKGLTQAEIGLTQPENRPNSNFRLVVFCTLQENAKKKNPGFDAEYAFEMKYL